MIENYTRLSSRMFTATVVGKDKNGRKITEGRETYKTPSGVYEIKDWYNELAIARFGNQEPEENQKGGD